MNFSAVVDWQPFRVHPGIAPGIVGFADQCLTTEAHVSQPVSGNSKSQTSHNGPEPASNQLHHSTTTSFPAQANSALFHCGAVKLLVYPEGLEPPCDRSPRFVVWCPSIWTTGTHSNWSAWRDLNSRPLGPKPSALARLSYTPSNWSG